MLLTGAEIVTRVLMEQGVDRVFGYPGGAALNVYDALYKCSDKITHYLTAHEQGACHAADGYARATGKTGVVFATSGPGATNLVTGIATAYMDSVPLVAITCNVPTSLIGCDSFQEVYIAGVTLPITKHNFTVQRVEDLADILRRAFKIASSGRPGPVLIDIPKDITANTCEYIEEPAQQKIMPPTVQNDWWSIANIINEAALRAVRNGRNNVSQSDIEESVEVVIAGYQRKNAVISHNEKKIIAYHEIGHAIVAAKERPSAPVHKITIIPRTSGALGYTMQVDDSEKNLVTKEDALSRIAVLTGGRSAEELVFGTCTSGASNDIEKATRIARSMVTRCGMSSQFDMIALETASDNYLGGDSELICSSETAAVIDKEVNSIIASAHRKALGIISDNINKLHELAALLLEKETISGDEFMAVLDSEKRDD